MVFSENIWILTRGLSPSRRVLRRAYKALEQLGLREVHLLPAHQKCSAPSPSSLGDTQPRLKDNIGITGVIKNKFFRKQVLNEWHTQRLVYIIEAIGVEPWTDRSEKLAGSSSSNHDKFMSLPWTPGSRPASTRKLKQKVKLLNCWWFLNTWPRNEQPIIVPWDWKSCLSGTEMTNFNRAILKRRLAMPRKITDSNRWKKIIFFLLSACHTYVMVF